MRKHQMFLCLTLSASLNGCATEGLGVTEVRVAGSKVNPLTFAEKDRSVVATGIITGLHAKDASIVVQVAGWAWGACKKDGQVRLPAVNPVPVDAFGWGAPIMDATGRRGAFEVTAEAAMPTMAGFGCPAADWTLEVLDVSFTSVHLTVTENADVVLDQDFHI